MSDNQLPARNYQLGATIILLLLINFGQMLLPLPLPQLGRLACTMMLR